MKLSEEYARPRTAGPQYAKCRNCGRVFEDDIQMYGVLPCPRCDDPHVVLERGYQPETDELTGIEGF